MRTRDLVAAAVGAVVATVLAGSVAWAAIPGPGGVIKGCFKLNNGQLRVIDSAAVCDASETTITWNQAGQQGPPGPPGEDGTDGTDGTSVTSAPEPAGANCASGGSAFTSAGGTTYACNGAKGETGATGSPGVDAPKQIAGFVASTGDPLGSGFTSSRRSDGAYRIVFPAGTWNPASLPVPIVTPVTAHNLFAVTLVATSGDGGAIYDVEFRNLDGQVVLGEFGFTVTQS